MDRRAFLLSASGAAVTPSPALTPQPGLLGGGTDGLFIAWVQGFMDRAAGAGWPRARLAEVFDDLQADPRVLAADRRQPELSKPVGDYIEATVSPSRVATGAALRVEDAEWLDPIAARFGPPAEILVAIWGVESSFGHVQGGYDVIRSLSTLAAAGRRQAWAESQLYAALRILFTGAAARPQLQGSWAGAMGQTQFTPSDYLDWAVDADGDGRRDIWGSSPDALGSTANFLANKAAWRRGQGWAREVRLPPEFDYGLSEGPRQTTDDWASLGVRTADALSFRAADAQSDAGLILPAGWTGPAFLVFPNHFAIRAYNNSMVYALSVGLIADRIAGAPALVQPWPQDRPTMLADRIAAQEALTRLGFDVGTPDGVLGLKTRQAARAWQRSRSLPADGYLDWSLIQRLKREGAVVASPAFAPTAAPGPAVWAGETAQ